MEKIYEATEQDREKLRKVHGELVTGEELRERLREQNRKVVCVGDRVSLDSQDAGVDTFIVDGREQREPLETNTAERLDAGRTFRARNPAGGITREAWNEVRKSIATNCASVLDIEGEEDLLALPAVAMLPDDAVVVYGLRERGAVLMEVGETRELVENLLLLGREGKTVVGGSWRFFHAGHRYLILSAMELGRELEVGITSDSMLEQKLGREPEEGFEARRETVEGFLEELPVDAGTVEIDDVYGTAVEEGDTLVVTPETRPGADRINEARREKGREPIEVKLVEKLEAADGGPVSSTRIEEGAIDRDGRTRELL